MPTARLTLAAALLAIAGNSLAFSQEGLVPMKPPTNMDPKDRADFEKRVHLKDPKTKWLYSLSKDMMRNTYYLEASIIASSVTNRDRFADMGTFITLESAPNKPDSVTILRDTTHKINCPSRCRIAMRFDSGPVTSIEVKETHPELQELIVVNPKPFIKSLKKSKVLILEFPVSYGMPNQLVYKTAGLRWD